MKRAALQMKLTGDTNEALRGHGLEAVDGPSRLQCPLCICPAFNGVLTTCKHAFHERCLKKALRAKPKQCPTCRKVLRKGKEFSPMRDKIQKTVISSVEVLCPQMCGAQVPFGRLKSHVKRDCVKTPFKCPHEGCNEVLTYSELSLHTEVCAFGPLASATTMKRKMVEIARESKKMAKENEKYKKEHASMQKKMVDMKQQMLNKKDEVREMRDRMRLMQKEIHDMERRMADYTDEDDMTEDDISSASEYGGLWGPPYPWYLDGESDD